MTHIQRTQSIIVKGEVEQVYRTCENLNRIAEIVKPVQSVTKTGKNTSRWTAEDGDGADVQWEMKLTRAETPSRIAWNSLEGDLQTSGQVTFTPIAHNETEVTITFQFVPPDGSPGADDIDGTLAESLRNFKAYVEDRPHRMHV